MSDAATIEKPAGIGHNSAAVGEMVRDDPAIIYRDDETLPALLREIEAEIAAHVPDVSTKSGRDAINSLAYSISTRKTAILKKGDELTEDWRKKTKAVTSLKSTVEAQMDALRDKAKAPFTAWKAADDAKQSRVADTLAFFDTVWRIPTGSTVEHVDGLIAQVEAKVINDDFGDSKDRALASRADVLERLRYARGEIVKAEADRQELERLRAAQEERDRSAREAEAKRLADEAERERIATAERRAAEEAEARTKAAAEAALAEERRKTEAAQQALEAEQRRQREEREAETRRLAAEAAELERRQKDREHAGRVMGAAKEALMEHAEVDEEAARRVVKAIVAGSVPSVTLSF